MKRAQEPERAAHHPPAAGGERPTPALGNLKIIALVRSAEVRSALIDAVEGLAGVRLDVRVGELDALGPAAFADEAPDVLLFDLDPDDAREMEVLHLIRDQQGAHRAIIVTSAKISPAGARRLVRDGVDDFIPQPLQAADVLDALGVATRKLRSLRVANAPRGKVFAFLKACGGVGATTLAVQTAFSLIQPGGRKAPKREVCLLDLDLQFGSAGLYLDLDSKGEIVDIIRSPERIDGDLVRGAMAQHQSGLHVLTAPGTAVPLEAMAPETAARLIDAARSEYDHVVVDLPHALTNWLEPVLSKADVVFLVTQLNVPAVRQARRLIDMMHDEGFYTLPLTVVLNRYKWQWGEGVRLKQAQQALGRPFEFFIPNDYGLVVDAINQGVPLQQLKRRNKISKSVRRMTAACLDEIAHREREEAAAAGLPSRPAKAG